jgi:hypothetical protein
VALGDPYIELFDFKDYLGIKQGKIDNDGALQDALDSASREIERICNRQFNKDDAAPGAATPRVYSPMSPRSRRIHVDDFHTLTDLVIEIDETGFGDWVALGADEYELHPYNGMVNGLPGWPFESFEVIRLYNPMYNRRWGKKARYRVTAHWGWEAVPADVRQACMMLAGDTYQQKDSPYGVMSDQYGVTLRPSGPTSGVGTQARLKLSRYARNRLLAA